MANRFGDDNPEEIANNTRTEETVRSSDGPLKVEEIVMVYVVFGGTKLDSGRVLDYSSRRSSSIHEHTISK